MFRIFLLTISTLLVSLVAAQDRKFCSPCVYLTYFKVKPDSSDQALKIVKDYQNKANSTSRSSSYVLQRSYYSYEYQINLVETWKAVRNDSDEAYKEMISLMNAIVIAPIIDKEHQIIDGGFGYNETLTEGVFTVTHLDTVPLAGQPDFLDRVAALNKYSLASRNNPDIKVFMGLWQTVMQNHFSIFQVITSSAAKRNFD